MILEIATIDIKDGLADEFEAAVSKAEPIFRRAKGCRSVALERSIESPQTYRLLVRWDTVENHTVDFQQSSDFTEWRRLVGHCFAVLPKVEHTRCALTLDIDRSVGAP
jgi:heme-degrading monooxygenase HmoA